MVTRRYVQEQPTHSPGHQKGTLGRQTWGRLGSQARQGREGEAELSLPHPKLHASDHLFSCICFFLRLALFIHFQSTSHHAGHTTALQTPCIWLERIFLLASVNFINNQHMA